MGFNRRDLLAGTALFLLGGLSSRAADIRGQLPWTPKSHSCRAGRQWWDMNHRSVPSRPRRPVGPTAPTPKQCTCRPLHRTRRHSGSVQGCSSGCRCNRDSANQTIRMRHRRVWMVRRRPEVALKDPVKRYGGRSGNRLPDLVAAISELRIPRYCATCAGYAAKSVTNA